MCIRDRIKTVLKITIKDKYHINSYEVNDPTLIKTEITSSLENFKLLNIYYPDSKKLKFEFSENELNVYEGEIFIGLVYYVSGIVKNGEYEIPVKVSYQACVDEVMYPTKSLTENIKVKMSELLSSKLTLQLVDFLFTYPKFRASSITLNTGIPKKTVAQFMHRLQDENIIKQQIAAAGRKPALYSFEPLLELVRV